MKMIDKAAVVAEIKKRAIEAGLHDSVIAETREDECYSILSFLDTLEVKEVDLDFQRFAKEMEFVFSLPSSKTKNTEEEPLNWEYAIAKHFYSLGLKTQKGE